MGGWEVQEVSSGTVGIAGSRSSGGKPAAGETGSEARPECVVWRRAFGSHGGVSLQLMRMHRKRTERGEKTREGLAPGVDYAVAEDKERGRAEETWRPEQGPASPKPRKEFPTVRAAGSAG